MSAEPMLTSDVIGLTKVAPFSRRGFMTATAAALIVGKAVLVANHARFISRFDRSPLIVPILFKTIIYWLAVLAARIVEAYIHYVISTGRAIGFIPFMWHDFSWRRSARRAVFADWIRRDRPGRPSPRNQ